MKNKEWWDSLSDDLKYQSYMNMVSANKSHADTLHNIVKRLLGNDYYTISPDIYGSNDEVWESIKYRYPDVNYNWHHTWNRIKSAIKDFFTK